MKKTLMMAGLLTALAIPAYADTAAGTAALAAGDYPAALAEFSPAAQQGDVEAQYALAQLYENGWGVGQSDASAWGWYRRAANRGHVGAQLKTAEFHEQGRGVPQSYKDAFIWYKKAADAGNVQAKGKLGWMEVYGRGKKPNQTKGFALLDDAAGAGDPGAQAVIEELQKRGIKPMPKLFEQPSPSLSHP